MIKEPRNRELTREDIYTEYLSRAVTDKQGMTEDTYKKMEEVKEFFQGKTKLELMIKGTVYFDKDFKKLFTFINKTYDITSGTIGLEDCLTDLDYFSIFMKGETINYFSEIENEYINYTRVLNAHIFMELT